jgi:PTH1 family peptidyl-tRNA hydrolase
MLKWISDIFSSKQKRQTDCIKPEFTNKKKQYRSVSNKFLIVGLGNIGAEYVNTRHIGFKILDYFAKEQLSFQTVKLGALAGTNLKEEPFSFKNTYMNLRGKAVQYWMDKKIFRLKTSCHY